MPPTYRDLVGRRCGNPFPATRRRGRFRHSSLRFSLPTLSGISISRFVSICDGKGVDIKWFGASEPTGSTSTPAHRHYIRQATNVENTLGMLSKLCNRRLPQSLPDADCRALAGIISASLKEVHDTLRGPCIPISANENRPGRNRLWTWRGRQAVARHFQRIRQWRIGTETRCQAIELIDGFHAEKLIAGILF